MQYRKWFLLTRLFSLQIFEGAKLKNIALKIKRHVWADTVLKSRCGHSEILHSETEIHFMQDRKCFLCGKIKHELRVRSYALKSTSYEFKPMIYELKSTSYEFKFTSYEFKSTSYEFKSTNYEFKSTSYEFKSTSSRIIKSMKTQINSLQIFTAN